jgi:hypothetical protein
MFNGIAEFRYTLTDRDGKTQTFVIEGQLEAFETITETHLDKTIQLPGLSVKIQLKHAIIHDETELTHQITQAPVQHQSAR